MHFIFYFFCAQKWPIFLFSTRLLEHYYFCFPLLLFIFTMLASINLSHILLFALCIFYFNNKIYNWLINQIWWQSANQKCKQVDPIFSYLTREKSIKQIGGKMWMKWQINWSFQVNQLNYLQMSLNRPFSEEEDKIIRYLYDELKIKKWSLVAKKMTEQHHMERNAKQCRDRYRQFLDPISCSQWTEQEEKQLYRLHNTIGNKWALIASYFHGKTDNYVKNHFYSKLRKALRHLNKITKSYFKKQFKQIKIATIYKIIQGFEQQFKEKPVIHQEVSDQCCVLKDGLIKLADEVDQMQDRTETLHFNQQRMLIQRIMKFSRNYRKKSKKQKRESLQVQELFKPAKRIQLILPVGENKDQDSQFERVSSVESSENQDNDGTSDLKEQNIYHYDSMRDDRDDIRKSPPIYIIHREEEMGDSPNSVRSGIDIRLSDLVSSSKMEEEQEIKYGQRNELQGCENMGNLDQKCSFGFMRGQSSFRSYRSESAKSEHSKTDMFGQIRISGQLKEVGIEIQNERDERLFNSQK